MTPWDEPLEYSEDEFDEPAPYQPEPDALTQAVGGRWYATRYELEQCRATFDGSTLRGEPERFDRYYVHSSVGPLLIDILIGDRDTQAHQAAKKHVEFKRRWCEDHERRYLVLTEDEASDVQAVRALLSPSVDEERTETKAKREAKRESARELIETPAQTRQRKRSGVQRPKAAA